MNQSKQFRKVTTYCPGRTPCEMEVTVYHDQKGEFCVLWNLFFGAFRYDLINDMALCAGEIENPDPSTWRKTNAP